MRKGNVLHSETHIFRLLDNLDQFLEEEKFIDKKEINFDVLLSAICWHDVWRAKREPYNFLKWLLEMLWEGIGSMLIFRKRAKEVGLSPELIREVGYAIRKHSDFQIFPKRTLESRILVDLDILDGWSLEKLEFLKKHYLSEDNIYWAPFRFGKFYFDHVMSRTTTKIFSYQWSRSEFNKRRKAYLAEVEKLTEKYGCLLKGS